MLASTSRVQLRSAIEATFGSESGATGRRKVRMTGESFNYALSFDSSKEIRSDRMTSDHILLGAQAAGGMNFELSYREYDEFFEDVFQSTWTALNTTGVSAALTSPTFTGNTLTKTGGGSLATLGLGAWVLIAGATGSHAANNGVHQLSLTVAATADVLTFEGTPFGVTGAATGTVTVSNSRLSNGVTQRSRLMEVEFADVAKFLTFRGMTASKLSLAFNQQAVVTGSFDFMGSTAMALANTSNIPGSDSVTFPTAYAVLNTSSNVAKLYEAGAALAGGTFARSVSIDMDNALRQQLAIGSIGPVGVGSGTIAITGKLSAYFASADLYDKFVNNTNSSLAIVVKDASNNGYALTLPSIEYTGGSLTAGQKDSDAMVDLDFSAKLDTVSGKMILLDRFGAAIS